MPNRKASSCGLRLYCRVCASFVQELAGYSGDPACSYGQKLCTHSFCALLGSTVINACSSTGLGTKCNWGVNYAAHDCDTQV